MAGDAADDAYEAGLRELEEGGFYARDRRGNSYRTFARIPQCKYCGSCDVEWVHRRKGWRLYDTNTQKLHVCPFVAKAEDFD